MQEHKRYRKPTTGAEIRNLLIAIEMEVPARAGLEAISQTEGQKFALALVKVANNEDDGQIQRKYLRSVLQGVSQRTIDALVAARLPVPKMTTLVQIAKTEGTAFANALCIVEMATGDAQETANARSYLENIIDEYGGGEIQDVLPSYNVTPTSPLGRGTDQPSPERVSGRDAPEVQPITKSVVADPRAQRQEAIIEAAVKAENQFGLSYKVYGGKAALCFAETKTRTGSHATVTIEVAESNGGRGDYNWGAKWAFQLTPSELFLVYGLFMGLPETFLQLELVGHGKKNDKSITIAVQGNKFFVSMAEKGSPKRAVPIPAKDAAIVIAMVGKQILADNPSLTWEMLGNIALRVCTMHTKTEGRLPLQGSE